MCTTGCIIMSHLISDTQSLHELKHELRIDTGDWGVNGGACFMPLVLLCSIIYLFLTGIIR